MILVALVVVGGGALLALNIGGKRTCFNLSFRICFLVFHINEYTIDKYYNNYNKIMFSLVSNLAITMASLNANLFEICKHIQSKNSTIPPLGCFYISLFFDEYTLLKTTKLSQIGPGFHVKAYNKLAYAKINE